ncbi:MAG TPA: phage head morphogenesis protein [Hungateiclostridium thermocellum]|uniref:Phage head morphogenesis protein, SPP1 gp7 family n=1 Tax=Acetivibrio thermocellus (strain ATCC 27405 / DSM 1237 / JCM 9322 / NBRC 103400 / NCIMB 10682 / NRRL B-4536 / VPI 7372) TaxID=203119 RepID=A3DI99_ACET2|nr:polymorphic toxin type 50 domain-containing protein [Acetivibrio thermocellus]ABN53678.1 phage head morphogenesis protein, SPP1 gp7 family [Acetivibrio thermocellus ATCC 27405]HBW27838.1 phage head morphogenesis protein [Acetivibrio thermocellus]
MNKKDITYWEKRQERKYLAGEKKLDEYYKGLQKAFRQAKREIQSVINDFYMRYAKENKVSYAEAQKLLDKAEIGELQDFIDLVNKNMGKYNRKLNNMSIKARITRYQALEKQIDAILQQLYAIEYEYKGKELLKEVYEDSYYRTWFNIDQYHGFHQEFAQINPRTIEELIKYPWNGASFSDRIWKQKDHMLQVLKEDITTMLIQGKNPQTLARDFARRFKTKEYEAYRLLHTESSFIIEQGTLAAYKEDGVEKYQILATLDMRTSDICRSEDGKIYDVDEATVGVNYPPYHPFCRTTTVPYYEDAEVGTRVARDPVTGRSYEVPANMTYEQWKNRYIDQPDNIIRQEILSNPERLDNYSIQHYNKHKEGTKQYEQYKQSRLKKGQTEQSSLLISYDEAKEIIKKYAGTGVFSRDRKGKWRNEEFVDVDSIIGVVHNIDGTVTPTNRIQIKYGKNSVHIVPVLPRKERNK